MTALSLGKCNPWAPGWPWFPAIIASSDRTTGHRRQNLRAAGDQRPNGWQPRQLVASGSCRSRFLWQAAQVARSLLGSVSWL